MDYVDMSAPSASAAVRDPFYVVKDKVVLLVKALRSDFERWKDLLETTNTAQNPEFAKVSHTIKSAVRTLRVDVKDLAQTIQIVESNRARFEDINDAELASRKRFVAETKGFLEELRDTMGSERTKKKIEADKQAASSSAGGRPATGLEREVQRSQNDYVSGRAEQQQMIERQQDEVLDDMSSALARLGDVAGTINVELDTQARMLDEFNEEMDQTSDTMQVVVKKIEKLLGTSNKGKLCCILWLFIIVVILFFMVLYL